jgi:hypothetical protein
MRVRPHAEIPDSTEDTNRDSDAPTQLWSGRLSLSSLTPRLRAARHRQRLEALLNTQTGITFEAQPDIPEPQPQSANRGPQSARQVSSTTPPVVAAAAAHSALSGPQLALFVAVGVAIGGIAALHTDHLLHPFTKQAREAHTEQQTAQQPSAFDARDRSQQVAIEESKRQDVATIQVAVAPAQPARSLAPKLRSNPVEVNLLTQSPPAALRGPQGDPQAGSTGGDLRIPTQLHPRINPLMTSNQVFKDQ